LADRRTDASKLTFPLQLVILIVSVAVSAYVSSAAGKWEVKSDIRNIDTRLQLGAEIAKAQAQAQEERFNALKASIDSTAKVQNDSMAAMSRRQEMQQIQIGELKAVTSELKAAIEKLSQGRK
jgi:hypothetical protein